MKTLKAVENSSLTGRDLACVLNELNRLLEKQLRMQRRQQVLVRLLREAYGKRQFQNLMTRCFAVEGNFWDSVEEPHTAPAAADRI